MSKTPEEVLAARSAACERLRDAAGDQLSWEWDGRFGAALAVVDAANFDAVLALVAAELPRTEDRASLANGPAVLQSAGAAWGGLMPGQKLFAAETGDLEDPLLFGAWWPWGNGARASIRVGLLASSEAAKALDLEGTLRGVFGL